MKHLITMSCLALLVACAANEEQPAEVDPRVEETKVYIQTVNPEVVSWVRYSGPLRWEPISTMHAIMRSEGNVYLLETERVCRALTSKDVYNDMADRRSMRGRLRSGIDTLRGCTIETIYRLPNDPAETTDEETGPNTTQEPE